MPDASAAAFSEGSVISCATAGVPSEVSGPTAAGVELAVSVGTGCGGFFAPASSVVSNQGTGGAGAGGCADDASATVTAAGANAGAGSDAAASVRSGVSSSSAVALSGVDCDGPDGDDGAAGALAAAVRPDVAAGRDAAAGDGSRCNRRSSRCA